MGAFFELREELKPCLVVMKEIDHLVIAIPVPAGMRESRKYFTRIWQETNGLS